MKQQHESPAAYFHMTDTAAHAGVVAPVESGCTCSVCRQDYPQIEEVGWFTSKW